jgi:hypothetical protein
MVSDIEKILTDQISKIEKIASKHALSYTLKVSQNIVDITYIIKAMKYCYQHFMANF